MKKNIITLLLLSVTSVSFAQTNSNINLLEKVKPTEQNIVQVTYDGINKEEVIKNFNNDVKTFPLSEEEKEEFLKQIYLTHPENYLTRDQFFVVTDRNPKKQNAALAFWNQDKNVVELIGFTKVSTGSVKKRHFYTPLGWFENLPEHGSYRAQGTKNENGIRGYGQKGMRVWDFGWVPSTSGYTKGLNIDIRFQMHATDPDYLEPRLGTPDSQGCVRVHQSMNKFLDTYGIIDTEYEAINSWVLKKDRIKIADRGSYLLVIETDNLTSKEETKTKTN
jgi:hypothetical protein